MTERRSKRHGRTPETRPTGSPDSPPPPPPPPAPSQSRWVLAICAALVLLDLVVYAQIRHHDFISLDDGLYVTENSQVRGGLSWQAVDWAFTTGHAANWHPITWLSHLIDVQFFGLDAGAHHVTSLIFHIVNTLLLFFVLRTMTGRMGPSAFVAALFGVHPLHVESVAWIAERKDVLSTMFWWLMLWAYAAYARKPDWRRYTLVAVCLALGLASKPMLVTAPFLLLLLDAWPLGRAAGLRDPRWLSLIREKLPLFALVAVSIVITFIVQRHGGAVIRSDLLTPDIRVENAVQSYVTYLRKAIWPSDLMVFYPYPRVVSIAWAGAAAAVLAGLSFVVYRLARRYPYVAVGWLWYLGTLVPVIGIVQVGSQAMADRYTYVPLVGIFIIVAFGVPDLLARWTGGRATRAALAAAATAVVLAFTVSAYAQAGYWTNSRALWQHALEVSTENYLAHDAIGAILAGDGKVDEAVGHFAKAMALNPTYAEAHYNYGLALMNAGRANEAETEYREALMRRPDYAEAHHNLGWIMAGKGRLDEAIAEYTLAIKDAPELAEAHVSLGAVLVREGRLDEALTHLREGVRLQPSMASAHYQLAKALAQQGDPSGALTEYREALRLAPSMPEAHNDLGFLFFAGGKTMDAIAEYTEAIRLNARFAEAWNNRGFALAAISRYQDALADFQEAVRLNPDFEAARFDLGLTLAGLGRFAEARVQFTEALRLNPRNEGARKALASLAGR